MNCLFVLNWVFLNRVEVETPTVEVLATEVGKVLVSLCKNNSIRNRVADNKPK